MVIAVASRRRLARRVFGLSLPGLTLAALLGGLSSAQAGSSVPTGGQVQMGAAAIASPSGSTLTVNQSSSRAIINWSNFSIGAGSTVQFNNGSGSTLNRVTGSSDSEIDGLLSATGSIYLINPNGVIIGKNGVVNVGGTFAASTQGLSSTQFLNGGDLTFSGSSNASVVNYGKIGALGGDVALIAARIENDGTINAPRGDVGLAAGYQVVLRDRLQDDGKFSVVVGGSNTSATNTGAIQAAEVELRANGGNVYALAGNTQSIIKATGVSTNDGRVFLVADGGGSTTASGEIDATQANGAGGQVETSGTSVNVDNLTVKAANWLVDPYDLTITSAAATSIDNSLNAGTSVELQTTASGTSGPGTANASGNGDIMIDSALSWDTSATLTLSAYRNIDFNADVTISGGGKVVLDTNQGDSGGTLSFDLGPSGFGGDIQFTGIEGSGQSLTINNTAYTLIYSMSELQNINSSTTTLAGNYALAQSLNASSTSSWIPIGTDGAGTVSNSGYGFTGIFEGLGNTISNLTINLPSNNNVGLFGASDGVVRDIGLLGGSVSGDGTVGALVGQNQASIAYAYATSTVTGSGGAIGGFVGENFYGGMIGNSYSAGAVSGGNNSSAVGGLVGYNDSATINTAYATGEVVGGSNSFEIGGLVGYAGGLSSDGGGTITNSYATGAVSVGTGGYAVGGLVGLDVGDITNSYATGAVSGGNYYIGGLVGYAQLGSTEIFTSDTISNVYATGAVIGGSGSSYVGGLVGVSYYGTISNAYATGAVSGSTNVGGFLGVNFYGTLDNDYWDTTTTGQGLGGVTAGAGITPPVGSGLTTAQLQGVLPSGLSGGVWGTGAGLFPYFLWQYPNGTPQSISGFAYSNGGGTPLASSAAGAATVSALLNGTSVGSASTGVNGYYYFLLAPGTISTSGSPVLAYTTQNSTTGAANAATLEDATGSLGNFDVLGNTLIAPTSDTTYSTASATSLQIQDTSLISQAASTNTSVKTLIAGLTNYGYIATGSGFTINESLTPSNGLYAQTTANDANITLADALTLSGNTGLMLNASGNVAIDAAITGTSGALTLDAGNAITTTAAVNVGTFTLLGGSWNQVATSLPTFVATDFVIAGGSFLRATGGNGSSGSPYQIADIYGLQGIGSAALLADNFALANNINASGTADWNSGAGFAPIGSSAAFFTGSLNGGNHTISNLTIDAPLANYVGLFGIVGVGGNVTNVVLTGASVTGASYVGALAGFDDGTLSGDQVGGAVTGGNYVGGLAGANYGTVNSGSSANDAVDGTSVVGGLVGYNTGSLANVSAGSGAVTGGTYVGGLVGYDDTNGTITSGMASGTTVTATGPAQIVVTPGGPDYSEAYAGGLVGWSAGSITDSSSADIVSASGQSFVGGLVGESYGSITGSSSTGAVTGSTWVGGLIGYVATGTISGSQASGAVTGTTYVGGLIGSNYGTLNGASSASGPVSGSTAVGGLIGYNDGSIATTSIESATVTATGGSYVGGLVGYNDTGGTITSAEATGAVTGETYVGGLVGANYGTLTNASSQGGTVSGSLAVGGLVGYNVGSISGSNSSDALDLSGSSSYVGGLVGYNDKAGTIGSSDASGAVTGGTYLGGLVGANYGMLNGASSSTGAVNGSLVVGGLVGYNVGSIATTSTESATVTATNGLYAGGLVGYNDKAGTISGAEASGAVTGESYVGGLAGANYGTLSSSSADGAVSGSAAIGGLVGYNAGMLTSVSAGTGTVTGSSDVGGLVGFNDTSGTITSGVTSAATVTASGGYYVGGLVGLSYGAITSSSSSDVVSASGGDFVGGLVGETGGITVGQSGGSITDSSSTGAVSGGTWVGGLVGFLLPTGTISGSQATGTVIGGTYVGGLVGDNNGGEGGANGGVSTSSATGGAVTGSVSAVGGLVGFNNGLISQSFSSRTVSTAGSVSYVGGLVGYNDNDGEVVDSYATGAVGAGSDAGGLVGYNLGLINTSWSDGAVTSGATAGGLVGDNGSTGVLTDVYWDESTSGQTNALGAGSLGSSTNVVGIGGTTGNNIYAEATYAGFNFSTIWAIEPGTSRPYLKNVSPQTIPQ